MEKMIYEKQYRRIEFFLLSIYIIYNTVMIVSSIDYKWNSWVGIVLLVDLALVSIINISELGNYVLRSKVSAILMNLNLLIYAAYVDNVLQVLPMFGTFVVFMGLYGIADIIYISVGTSIFIFLHATVQGNVDLSATQNIMQFLLQLANMFLLEYVVYGWTKRNSEGSKMLQVVIGELKSVENSKDDFLANVSHEIRTPINSICGISEIVLKEDLPESVKANLLDIQLAGRSLMSVVSDVLDFSELQSGKIELEEESYNITSTINDVINMTMARIDEKNIELIVDCDANIPSVLLGDEKKIRRVIMKLVDNAIKFTDEGCVSVKISSRKESYGINLVVSITDTGIGMEEESLKKLFDKFTQVDASRNRQKGGIGLGLAISYTLVKKMGGAITIKSQINKGSTVQFVVPQKVIDDEPIIAIENKDDMNVATYINMEQFSIVEIRDEYSNAIQNMVEQLRCKCHMCRNLGELQRRMEKEKFTHVFISTTEYLKDKEYFDRLAKKTKLIVALDDVDDKYITNQQVYKMYKPFYILSIVSAINGISNSVNEKYVSPTKKFTTENVKVMVVDDNRMNLRVIEGFLKEYGINVVKAISGREALEKIMTEDYDFVFMDHMMPDMDGVETMQRIRQKVGSYFQRVPILALTANAVAGTRDALLAEGFNDFIEKPVERSVLERVLKRNLSKEKIIYLNDDVKKSEKIIDDVNTDIEIIISETSENKSLEEILETNGVDAQTGIMYCNGLENYLEVLQGYCEDCDELEESANNLFKKNDWKNYTIVVHGMKSSLKSIGAMRVSDLAKELEFAGKEGRIEYILEHHNELMDEYRKLFYSLRKYEGFAQEENVESVQKTEITSDMVTTETIEMEEISEESFNKIIADMEEAMYSLDGEKIMENIIELEKYQYHKNPLKKLLEPVKRKVEMTDYMSAVDHVVKVKEGIARSDT